ncbi:MAG: ERF family protein [Planctomycetota bacterium]
MTQLDTPVVINDTKLHDNPTKELIAALAAASEQIGMARKSGHNKYDDYDYANLEDYLKAIREPCSQNGLFAFSRTAGEPEYFERKTKSGNAEIVCRVPVETRVMHAESGGSLGVTVIGEGQDRGDKAIYKAITGARKYSIAMLFGIYTTDDPEVDSHDPPQSTPQSAQASSPPAGPPTPPPTLEERVAAWKGKIIKLEDSAALLSALKKTGDHEDLKKDAPLYGRVLIAFAQETAARREAGRLSDAEAELISQMLGPMLAQYEEANPNHGLQL